MSEPTIKLPVWARVSKDIDARLCVIIEADTEGYLTEWLHLLGVIDWSTMTVLQGEPVLDDEGEPTGVLQITQYWLECAYQCAKMDIQEAVIRSDYDQRAKPLEIRFSSADRWKMTNFPEGRGWFAATKQFEARGHFIRVRGRLP